ncbi:MAG: hypothetical protein PGN34_21145 [Methylobacterium frigidaeris]
MMRSILPCAAAGIALALVVGTPSRAQDLPRFDVRATCTAVQEAGTGRADADAIAGCVRDETAAREQVRRRWAAYSPASRQECAAEVQIGGTPSYVDLATCLELANDALLPQPGAE